MSITETEKRLVIIFKQEKDNANERQIPQINANIFFAIKD